MTRGIATVTIPSPSAGRAWLRRPGASLDAILLSLSVGTVILLAFWQAFILDRVSFGPVVSSVVAPFVDLAAAALVLRASRTAEPGRARGAWRLVGIAMVLYALGDGLWCALDLAELPTSPSVADVAYVVFYPVLGMALLVFRGAARPRRDTIRLALDSAIIVIGGGMVVWHTLLRWALIEPATDPIAELLALGYPVGDLILLFGISAVALRRPAGIDPRALVALVGGLALMFGADVGYGELQLAKIADSRWFDLAYLGSSMAIATAGYLQAHPGDQGREEPTAVRALSALMPLVALGSGFAVLLGANLTSSTPETPELAMAATALTGLVIARQEMLSRENARLLADRARREVERRYQSLEGQSSETYFLVDPTGVVAYASPSIERVLDVNPATVVGRPLSRIAHAESAAALDALIADTAAGRSVVPLEWQVWTRRGGWREVETVPSSLLGDPAIGKIVLTTRDVRERKALIGRAQQATEASLRDVVTGLPNRVLFKDRVNQALAASDRNEKPIAVLLVDLDGFSRMNVALGHVAGDRVLTEVGRRLTIALRSSDSVARVAADEFAILLAVGAGLEQAIEVAHRVQAAVAEPMTVPGSAVQVTACVGVALGDHATCPDAQAMMRLAGTALVSAKQRGPGSAVVFEPSMLEALSEQFAVEADLRHAIANGELVLEYQPIVDLATGELASAEALVRWDHPTRGRLSPGEFIPLAEERGLIGEIGLWVLRRSCRDVATWANAAAGQIPRVSVNLAASQIADPQLPWVVRSALAEFGAAPGWLTLEATEGQLIADTQDAVQRLHALRALGVRVSIDDFGTGYSSLAYLQRLPVDHIKIDRSFVTPLDDPKHDAGLVRAVVEIARTLGLSTVAEGIETERQLERLRDLGVAYGQGFLLGRPGPVEAIVAAVSSGPGALPELRRLLAA